MSPGSAVVDRMANINWIGTCTNTIVPNKPNSIHADASLKVEKVPGCPNPSSPHCHSPLPSSSTMVDPYSPIGGIPSLPSFLSSYLPSPPPLLPSVI